MFTCQNCGKPVYDVQGDGFCLACSFIEPEEPPRIEAEKPCRACGLELYEDETECANCGCPVVQKEPYDYLDYMFPDSED